MNSPFWYELIIINPADPSNFLSNLCHLFEELPFDFDDSQDLGVRLRLAFGLATSETRFIKLRCHKNRWMYEGEPYPNPTLLQRYSEVMASFRAGHYHEVRSGSLCISHHLFLEFC